MLKKMCDFATEDLNATEANIKAYEREIAMIKKALDITEENINNMTVSRC